VPHIPRIAILPFELRQFGVERRPMKASQKKSGAKRRSWRQAIRLLAASLLLCFPALAQSGVASLLEKARAEEKSGDFSGAEGVYQQALRLEPGNPEVLKRLGVVEQTELKFNDSIAHLKEALARDANYPEANFFLGVSYLGLGDLASATQSLQQELRTPKPHPRCRYYLGMTFESAGRMDDAIAEFHRAAEENPKDADSLYQLARIYKNASVQMIDRLRAIDPDSFQLHMLQGEVYAEGERYPEAIKEYQAALGKRPDAAGIHFAIGVAYWAQRQFVPAKQEFLEAWKENGSDALTNLYLGDIAVRDREYTEARTYLRVAEQGQADAFRVHLLMGKCYKGEHDPEKAKAEFLKAETADAGVAEVHYLLAQTYQELKDTEGSAKEFAEFERLSRTDKEKAQEAHAPN
jgi:tetratricopeptide (TPR) repeat protein